MAQAQIQQAQASKQTTQPMGAQGQPIDEEKSKWWIWLIIAIVIIAAGAGAYIWLI